MTTFQEQQRRNSVATDNWLDAFVRHPAAPATGPSPREVLWRRGKSRLYHYRRQAEPAAASILIVPWVGISHTYILDFLPGLSYVEYFIQRGHDVFLLDWGEFGEEDRNFGFEQCLFDLIPGSIERALEASGSDSISLTGICVGGTLTSMYLALNPNAPVNSHIAVVPLINADEGGLFKTWLTNFPSEQMVRTYGMLPTHIMGSGFKMLRPLGDMAALLGLSGNLDRPEYITLFKAMSRWGNQFLPMPGRFFLQLSREIYSDNRLMNGEFTVNGRTVDLKAIETPLLLVSAERDHIVPRLAARALFDAVSSTDKEYLDLPGGHISVFAGRSSKANLWPKMDQWLAARSGQAGSPTEEA